MTQSCENSLHPNEKYCTYRAQAMCYMIRGVFHLQKISENFYWEFWEFPFGKRAFHLSQVPIRLQAPLRRFTKKPDALVNCSAIFANASFFVAFPSNKCLLSACVVMRSLTSACSRRSRFTVVETSSVNERTFQSCSCNILHGKHAPVKKASNKQEFLPTIFI